MSSWNHRVVKQVLNKGKLNEEDWFSVREVFYNSDGSIWAYSENPASICGEDIKSIRKYLEWCLKALDEPILVDGEVKFTETKDDVEMIYETTGDDNTDEYESKIILNSAKCLSCEDVLVSTHRHDFVSCQCGNLAVDGGLDYLKRSTLEADKVLELSKYEVTKKKGK